MEGYCELFYSFKVVAHEDTLLRTLLQTQMFACLLARVTFVADTQFVSYPRDTKLFLIFSLETFRVRKKCFHGNRTFVLFPARLLTQETS